MKYKRERGSIKQAAYIVLLGLGFSACATTTDANYADRNNLDSARSRCVQLARTMGYQDVGVDSVDRDGLNDSMSGPSTVILWLGSRARQLKRRRTKNE